MSIRQKVNRVFHRSPSTSGRVSENSKGMKIEYYKRREVPPPKFKGPVDRDMQKLLAAWNFEQAQCDRPRSPNLSLSPCTTRLDRASSDEEETEHVETVAPEVSVDASPSVVHDEYASGRDGGSSSSTAVEESDGYTSSAKTLYTAAPGPKQSEKGSAFRYTTSPPIRSSKPQPAMTPKGGHMPFAPDDLSRALNGVQICT